MQANKPEFDDETCREQDEREFDGEWWSGGMHRFYPCGCESYNRCYSDGCLGEEEFHTTCEMHSRDENR